MCKLLCKICNKEYANLNKHYETKLHKNKVEQLNKKKEINTPLNTKDKLNNKFKLNDISSIEGNILFNELCLKENINDIKKLCYDILFNKTKKCQIIKFGNCNAYTSISILFSKILPLLFKLINDNYYYLDGDNLNDELSRKIEISNNFPRLLFYYNNHHINKLNKYDNIIKKTKYVIYLNLLYPHGSPHKNDSDNLLNIFKPYTNYSSIYLKYADKLNCEEFKLSVLKFIIN